MALDRKAKAAGSIADWVAPSTRFAHTKKHWTATEDTILLATASNVEAAGLLSRTEKSVNIRRWRLTRSAA